MMMNSNKWIRQFFVTLFIGLLTFSVAANESPLTQPKADGLIGEQADGYLGLVTQNVPADIRQLVNEVNAKRKAGYQEIAAKQGTSLSEVEKVGGKTAIEKTLRGNYIRDENGVWRKK
ncbi:MAG TPA: YdbL family protein [Xanthomonadales bacterium]